MWNGRSTVGNNEDTIKEKKGKKTKTTNEKIQERKNMTYAEAVRKQNGEVMSEMKKHLVKC